MHKNNIPAAAREIFDDITNEVFFLKAKWLVFRELFGVEDHVKLLNQCAPTTFYYFLFALLDDVNLSLTRLVTDPARMKGRDNSNFEQLIRKLDPKIHKPLIEKLEAELTSLRKKCPIFIKRRHRRLAHRDWKTEQPINPEPLPDISRAMVEDVLPSMEVFLSDFNKYFNQESIMLSPGDVLRDVHNLLQLLETGLGPNRDAM
jgi:AbiU2